MLWLAPFPTFQRLKSDIFHFPPSDERVEQFTGVVNAGEGRMNGCTLFVSQAEGLQARRLSKPTLTIQCDKGSTMWRRTHERGQTSDQALREGFLKEVAFWLHYESHGGWPGKMGGRVWGQTTYKD